MCLGHVCCAITRASGPQASPMGRAPLRTRTERSTSDPTRPVSTTGRVSITRTTIGLLSREQQFHRDPGMRAHDLVGSERVPDIPIRLCWRRCSSHIRYHTAVAFCVTASHTVHVLTRQFQTLHHTSVLHCVAASSRVLLVHEWRGVRGRVPQWPRPR